MCASMNVSESKWTCQKLHTVTDCCLAIHTLSGDVWVKRIATRVWMCVWIREWAGVCHMWHTGYPAVHNCVPCQACISSYFELFHHPHLKSRFSSKLFPLISALFHFPLYSYMKLRIECPHWKSCSPLMNLCFPSSLTFLPNRTKTAHNCLCYRLLNFLCATYKVYLWIIYLEKYDHYYFY